MTPELDERLRAEAQRRRMPLTRLVEFAVEQLLDRLASTSAPVLGIGSDGAVRPFGAAELAGAGATHDDESAAARTLPLPFVADSSSLVSPSPASSAAPLPATPAASKITRRRRGAVKAG